VGDILNDFEIRELIYEYTQDHDERLKEEIYTRLVRVLHNLSSYFLESLGLWFGGLGGG
jgi:hypothetical protein